MRAYPAISTTFVARVCTSEPRPCGPLVRSPFARDELDVSFELQRVSCSVGVRSHVASSVSRYAVRFWRGWLCRAASYALPASTSHGCVVLLSSRPGVVPSRGVPSPAAPRMRRRRPLEWSRSTDVGCVLCTGPRERAVMCMCSWTPPPAGNGRRARIWQSRCAYVRIACARRLACLRAACARRVRASPLAPPVPRVGSVRCARVLACPLGRLAGRT